MRKEENQLRSFFQRSEPVSPSESHFRTPDDDVLAISAPTARAQNAIFLISAPFRCGNQNLDFRRQSAPSGQLPEQLIPL
jgi:hypothetical protein